MKQIDKYDLELIDKFCKWELSKDEFVAKTSFKADIEQLMYLLDNTKNKITEYNDNQCFDTIFWRLPRRISKSDEINMFKTYLLKNWHHEHEGIVGAFQKYFNDDKNNISVLLKAIEQIPKYLNHEDLKYPYIRKIIYAIGAQPEPYNIEALEDLRKSSDQQIKDLALHQIEKRKELGCWEFEKNILVSS
jgi:hypothetical protein